MDLGRSLGVDAAALAAERAAVAGLSRGGRISAGGSARLVPAGDDWLAVNLARADDRAVVAAWRELEPGAGPGRRGLPRRRRWACGRWSSGPPVIGMPRSWWTGPSSWACPWLGSAGLAAPARSAEFGRLPLAPTPVAALGRAAAASAGGPPLVVDLSSLWAGPLCSRLLADRGARVVKVESTQRPDGARRGPPAFYDRLHAGTASVALDLSAEAGRAGCRALVARADVVVEASRPRALLAMGIDAEHSLATGSCRAWVSITGYGRRSNRVAFGDDAAVAGGLVGYDADGPCFVADAVADPLAGVVAAAAVVAAAEHRPSLAPRRLHGRGGRPCRRRGGGRGVEDPRATADAPRPMPARGAAPARGSTTPRAAAQLGIDLG